ncbi:MAG: branched-chain amino acid ABC transporter permease [Deltaproteobacteria bacterium]|nr:branched-chain amino acid ABC transporter permease [Deltaproteobacteria bacterium]
MSGYIEGVLALMGINILLALSVYAILMTDQCSVGNAGFMAIGAYTSAYLTVKMGLPLLPALVIGAALASLIGLLIGIPALRLKGLYLVIATLGFGEMVRTFFLNFEPTGGASGFRGPMGTTLFLIYAWVVGFIVVFWLLDRSRLGRSFDAVRDDPEAASTMGLDVIWHKVWAFGFGAFIAGIAGGLYAHYMFYIESGNFSFLLSTMILLYVLLGGMQTFWGAVIGAAIFSILPEVLRFIHEWRLSFYGAVLVAMMIFRPSGIITRQMVRDLGERLDKLFQTART